MGKLGFFLGGVPGWLIEEGFKTVSDSDAEKESTEAVREDEIERVLNLIEKGREQGLSEIEIEISHGLAKNFSTEAGAPIEGIPTSISCNIAKDANGKYMMKVKYLPKNAIDKLRDLKKLLDEQVLSEEEFVIAKSELLKQL